MNPALIFGLTGLALFCLGLIALFSQPAVLRKILALNICGSGIFLLMISVAYDPAGGAPDPVLHALVLTGIVISVSITGFALALAGGQGVSDHENQAGSANASEAAKPQSNYPAHAGDNSRKRAG